jgi:peptidoglycan hydrolase-like protein with peptidoglycan-binding domain
MPAFAFAQNGSETTNVPPAPSAQMAPNGMRGASMALSAPTIRRVQERLNALGFGAGTPSGTWDEATHAAIERFQKANHLQATGGLNAETLKALHIGA